MRVLDRTAFTFAMLGALNMGLTGLGAMAHFDGDVLRMLLGSWPEAESFAYVLIGASAVWLVASRAWTSETYGG